MAELITKKDKLLQELEKYTLDELKENKISEIKEKAKNILADSDWYIVRKQETGKEVPQDILDYRANIRNQSETIETQINELTTKIEVNNYTIDYEE